MARAPKTLVLAGLTLVLAACGRDDPDPPPPAHAPTRAPLETPPQPPPAPAPPRLPAPPPLAAQQSDDWRVHARPEDGGRLQRLDAAWIEAVREVAASGHTAELRALGALGDPTVALPNPQPAPGLYRCRTVKLGGLGLIAYGWFRCRIDLTPGGDLTYAKQTGSQRGTGEFFPDPAGARRLIFLGAVAWGSDEPSAPAYGADPERDQIGVLERIGPDRYRLALPWPRQESDLDLIELERVGN